MSIREVIEEKKAYIEERTENEVSIHEGPLLNSKAILDWGTWNKIGLPVIRHRHVDHEDDWVHVLHELIHIENFFFDGYWLVAHNNAAMEDVDRIFKQIPEDYIAHKIIYGLGINPIDREFVIENLLNIGLNDRDIGAKLVLYHTYLEFNRDLEGDYNIVRNQIQYSKPNVFELAQESLDVLDSIDINNINNHKVGVDRLIRIFAPEYYGHRIYSACLRKRNGSLWDFYTNS